MKGYELDALKRLNIPLLRWGKGGKNDYRVKVKNDIGRFIFITNISRPKYQAMLSKTYKVKLDRIKKHVVPNYKPSGSYEYIGGKLTESHTWYDISQTEFEIKAYQILSEPKKAFKVNIQLGYVLIDRTSDIEQNNKFYPLLEAIVKQEVEEAKAKARKNMPIKAFKRSRLARANGDKLGELIKNDDETSEEFNERKKLLKQAYSIYHKMKANIAGGPSIIFNRFAKACETTIRGGQDMPCGALNLQIEGRCSNSGSGVGAVFMNTDNWNNAYIWHTDEEPVEGGLTKVKSYRGKSGFIEAVLNDKLFGFAEVDIETPEHLKEYFSEMCPIFKNIEIDPNNREIIGDHMYDYNQEKFAKAKDGYYEMKEEDKIKGTETYQVMKAILDEIIDAYELPKKNNNVFALSEIDMLKKASGSKKLIGDMMKLVGNSAFGHSGMDVSKHREVKFSHNEVQVRQLIEKPQFVDLEEYGDSSEVLMKKRTTKLTNPIHVSIAIYQLAKLRMLQFYYDCIDYYFDRSDFQNQEMDTDSAYIAFSDPEAFKNLFKTPELKAHFEEHKMSGFLVPIRRKTIYMTKRLLNYICYLSDETGKLKVSAKGVQQGGGKNMDILTPGAFENVVKNKVSFKATNTGFRIDKVHKRIVSY
ncbi:hypothetical protein Poli38472_006320 [Pythium oligandrum]|uniref:DNA-directed DNA polymerase n=1 Tax=Pythium oligandrum TaxID=41045 RepID=A0A8K1FRC4_PYTOL|nr:hypothetical protein Poli38472_006320 [Pythium oligandrum]|eukprot:TMW68852.1 hypothetical protein Poli38472_006320 [Pythium oligandrum]